MKVRILRQRPGYVDVGRTVSAATLPRAIAIEWSRQNYLHVFGGGCLCSQCRGTHVPPGLPSIEDEQPKRRGRPKGSKNKPKEDSPAADPSDIAPTDD